MITHLLQRLIASRRRTFRGVRSPARHALIAAELLEGRRLLSGTPTWLVTAGGASKDVTSSVVALADGSTVSTGFFSGSVKFGETVLASKGKSDLFVSKIGPSGDLQWLSTAGVTSATTPVQMVACSDGGFLISGMLEGVAVFGSKILKSSGSSDIFVAKMSADGTFSWARRYGGSGVDRAESICVLPDGSSLLTGSVVGSSVFGSTTLTTLSPTAFIAKLDPAGVPLWAVKPSGGTWSGASAVSTRSDGTIVVAGYFAGTMSFGAVTVTAPKLTFETTDAYLATLSPKGEFISAQRFGGYGQDGFNGLVALGDGSVVVSGSFEDAMAIGGKTLTSGGAADIVYARIGPAGNVLWATRAGGLHEDYPQGMTLAPDGSLLVTGRSYDDATFGAVKLAAGWGFVAKMTVDGAFAWAVHAGASGVAEVKGISVFGDGSIVIGGEFEDTTMFGGRSRSKAGDMDAFVAKLTPWGTFTKPTLDLDGDGITDLLWRNAAQQVVGWILDRNGKVTQTRSLGGDANWALEATGDFDGNGVTDILWRNAVSGAVLQRLSRGDGTVISSTVILTDVNQRVEATGDFDGDLQEDLVWRQSQTGANEMWLMQGATKKTVASIGGSLSSRLVSTGPDFDVNADGRTDLVWRHVSGASTLWRMNGTVTTSAQSLGGDATWQIVGSGDFNGDGRHDLLWGNTSGAVVQWLMTDAAVTSALLIGGGPLFIQIATSDVDNDGRTDIVWRGANGACSAWTMDGGKVVTKRSIGGDATWSYVRRPGRLVYA